jgi:antitoxin MazE
MQMKLKKWGNSAAIRIPAAALASLRLRIDDTVEVREEDGRIVVEPVRPSAPSLDALLDAIRPENLHDEHDFGPAAGREAW